MSDPRNHNATPGTDRSPTSPEKLRDSFEVVLGETGDERKAAARVIGALDEPVRAHLSGIAEAVSFQVRRYGQGQFYVWPVHPLFDADPVDPWPASRYPRNVLLVDLALRDTTWLALSQQASLAGTPGRIKTLKRQKQQE